MDINQLRKRKLDPIILFLCQIKTSVTVEYEGRICTKDAYFLFGINITGKRKLLAYGINFKDTSEFWLNIYNDIKSRGVDKIIYASIVDTTNSIRALQINFTNVNIINSPYILIDKINLYFTDNYNNKIPYDIASLYTCLSIEEYKNKLEEFNLRYSSSKLVSLLLHDHLISIEKYYNIDYNIRQLLFNIYFIRDFKKRFKTAMNKIKIISNLDDIVSSLYSVESTERSMFTTKSKFICVIEILYNDIKEFL